jgi:hypothetical protein
LAPFGLKRKGQSRFWHDDYGWRAFFVEFQPSSWSKGTYCNVGVSWLWDESLREGHWAFHVSERVGTPQGQFISYEPDPTDFGHLVQQLATDAAQEVSRLRDRFNSVAAVAAHYAAPATGWPGYHGAVALGLIGRRKEAAARFEAVARDAAVSDIEWIQNLGRSARALAELVTEPDAFALAIEGEIARTRADHRLRPIEHPLSQESLVMP